MNKLSKYRKELAIVILQSQIIRLSLDKQKAQKEFDFATTRMLRAGGNGGFVSSEIVQSEKFLDLHCTSLTLDKYKKQLYNLGAQV